MATIFQNLKKIKHLDRKITKNSERLHKWCSHFDNEETQYEVPKLIQSINDMIVEKAKLQHELHKTNVMVAVSFRGQEVSIDELIALVSLIFPAQIKTLQLMRRRERGYNTDEKLKVVMNYDPVERDNRIDVLENMLEEAEEILDNINIITEIVS